MTFDKEEQNHVTRKKRMKCSMKLFWTWEI